MQCRIAPSLGALEGHPNDVWGTTPYVSRSQPTVFFGLYDMRDYIALFRHQGKKDILWAGSDLRNLVNGFMLNDGKLKVASQLLRRFSPVTQSRFMMWFVRELREAEHYVENEFEAGQLGLMDIECRITPSFMGNVRDYEIEYRPA